MSRWRAALSGLALVLAAALAVAANQLPAVGAGGLLHPSRRPVSKPAPESCHEATVSGADVTLKGWRCTAQGTRVGTLVYLHGVADNRASGVEAIRRFGRRGFDVLAYDSRAHGESGGETCTYGFFEKLDLRRILDTADAGPVVLMGASLGAAVALQHASEDPRVTAVVAAETFSDLRTVATERAPFFFSRSIIARAFETAERQGHFLVDAVSPANAAARITAPVLLIHGAADVDTGPDHSQRVFAGLRGPKRLVIVPGAAHNGSLRAEVWDEIERWVDDVVGRLAGSPKPEA
jgi:pimeloyl-ACP methyl ester carboxylesterase